MSKKEAIRIARDIGTYDISIKRQLDCPFLPMNPSTKAKLEKVEYEESKLNVNSMIKEALQAAKTINIK